MHYSLATHISFNNICSISDLSKKLERLVGPSRSQGRLSPSLQICYLRGTGIVPKLHDTAVSLSLLRRNSIYKYPNPDLYIRIHHTSSLAAAAISFLSHGPCIVNIHCLLLSQLFPTNCGHLPSTMNRQHPINGLLIVLVSKSNGSRALF